ncbi:ovate family protein 12 [Actinidia rufa]|uniref:Transcription repressor n=1 Tax=Actinidia rufa TaxID=165716 RepID=A0A7J0HAE0_9ERIC|nr:ovate family protein 12 [Actinidia rufa]
MRSTLGKNLNMCFTGTAESSSFKPEADLGRPSPKPVPILVKNFNSLYDLTFDHSKSPSLSAAASSDDLSSPFFAAASPDLAAILASRRFFFSSPGRSNSIVDSSSPPPSSFSSSSSQPGAVVGGGIPIPTYSSDLYGDFRRSMQEMVEAHELVDVGADWAHLHELLTCYLALNPKSTHKFIVRAFSDLLVSLLSSRPRKRRGRRSDFSGSSCGVSRRCV